MLCKERKSQQQQQNELILIRIFIFLKWFSLNFQTSHYGKCKRRHFAGVCCALPQSKTRFFPSTSYLNQFFLLDFFLSFERFQKKILLINLIVWFTPFHLRARLRYTKRNSFSLRVSLSKENISFHLSHNMALTKRTVATNGYLVFITMYLYALHRCRHTDIPIIIVILRLVIIIKS